MRFRTSAFLVCALLVPIVACSDAAAPANGPATLPVSPPDPTPAPTVITPVSAISGGTVTSGQVLIFGQLTTVATADQDQWNFSDGSGTVVVDFPSSHVPSAATDALILGSVKNGQVDVITWDTAATPGPGPVNPPITPPNPTPPPLIFTTVAEILDGNSTTQVLLSGQLTGPTSDNDEWHFSDNTGSIVLDFPSSSNIPGVGAPIFVLGKVASSEVDVETWCHASSCGS
jgi:uncharacterized protein YdeI (BOF family)